MPNFFHSILLTKLSNNIKNAPNSLFFCFGLNKFSMNFFQYPITFPLKLKTLWNQSMHPYPLKVFQWHQKHGKIFTTCKMVIIKLIKHVANKIIRSQHFMFWCFTHYTFHAFNCMCQDWSSSWPCQMSTRMH